MLLANDAGNRYFAQRKKKKDKKRKKKKKEFIGQKNKINPGIPLVHRAATAKH